jgi:ABC-type multidrug transport system fused ATPase/permease subunit
LGDRRTASRDGAGLRDLLRLVRGHRTWILVAVTLTLAASGLAMVQPLVVKWLIDSARGKPIVWSAVVLLIGLFAGQALVQTFGRYVLARTSEGIVLGIRLNLIDHVLRLPMPAYDRYRIGDLISRTSADTTAL